MFHSVLLQTHSQAIVPYFSLSLCIWDLFKLFGQKDKNLLTFLEEPVGVGRQSFERLQPGQDCLPLQDDFSGHLPGIQSLGRSN